MKRLNNKSGFTLLEIIIVIIILGVLASLALPKLVGQIEVSRGSEALGQFQAIKDAMHQCSGYNNYANYLNCDTYVKLGLKDNGAGEIGGAALPYHFTYGVSPAFDGPKTAYTVTATRSAVENGVTTDTVVMKVSTGGIVTRSGTGAFAGIQ